MSETTDPAKGLTKKAPGRKKPTTGAKNTAAKKAPAKKAAAKKAAPKASGTATRAVNGPSGWLAEAINKVCEDFAAGKVDTEGKPLTPHRIAQVIESRGLTKPSSGAVAACLDRWVAYGYITVIDKPKSFKAFTAKGKKDGLEALVAAHRKAAHGARKSS